jgi:hypothetical protein
MGRILRTVGLAAFLALVTGCPKVEKPSAPKADGSHSHPTAGPHGGPVAGLNHEGKGYGHTEVTVDPEKKQVIVYFIDETAKQRIETASAQDISNVEITFKKPKEKGPIKLTYDEKLSGDKGIAFVGDLDEAIENKGLQGEIRAELKIENRTIKFDTDFPEKPH